MSSGYIDPAVYLAKRRDLVDLIAHHDAGTSDKVRGWDCSALQTIDYLHGGGRGAPPSFTAWLLAQIHDRGIVGHLARLWEDYSLAWVGMNAAEVRTHLIDAGWITPSYSEALEVAEEEFGVLQALTGGIPHVLYRFFAANGELLYIGLTLNPGTRWKKHAKEKPWWTEVVGITLEHFPSREAVEAAEVAAIRAERPVYNITHNRGRWVNA